MTSSTATSRVECGYCGADVEVTSVDAALNAHNRTSDGKRMRCQGSRQRAFIYPGNLRDGDVFLIASDPHRRQSTVAGQPTVSSDSNMWTVPLDTGGNLRRLAGDTLLRLWIRQGGDR